MPKAPKLLSVYEFGKTLVDTMDLDPVYVVLHYAELPRSQLEKYLLAYWCFYHMGTAAWITEGEGPNYWNRMRTAAASKEYPRKPERRHFRGENARKSVEYLEHRGLKNLLAPFRVPQLSVSEVMEIIQTWVGFGPWIAFKVADMLERLRLCKVVFDDGAMFLFDSPKKGAQMLWALEKDRKAERGEAETHAVTSILSHLAPRLAPPSLDRPLNSQEAETVLCKWKSYVGGHYKLGEDIESCRSSLEASPAYKLKHQLLSAGKEGKLW